MKNEIIGVIGTGVMGGGIAQLFAENGFHTLIWDASEEFTVKGYENIRKRLNKSVEKGKLSLQDSEAIISRIKPVKKIEELAPSGLVIEAIIEDFDSKKKIFSQDYVSYHSSPPFTSESPTTPHGAGDDIDSQ